MQVFYYDSIDSTSSEALRLLQEKNLCTPFAVTAKEQTAGRGQRSREWKSPGGNFYLSIASTIPSAYLRYLPLHVACILAKWLGSKMTEQPMIKWPNDLLLNRKKVAGVLCETLWEQSSTHCKAVIGIGINVEEKPLLENSDYESECIGPWLKNKESVEDLVLCFLKFWEHQSFKSIEELLEEFQSYHLPRGSLWKDQGDPGSFYTNEGFSQEGHLRMRNCKTGEMRELVSARHSLVLSPLSTATVCKA